MKSIRSVYLVALAAFCLGLAPGAFAQQVANSINGIVVNAQGEPVVGAEVEILHVPSGTRRTAITRAGGLFNAQGLRIGGPYRVTATQSGAVPAVQEDIFLSLSDPVTVQLVVDTQTELDRLEVIGSEVATTFSADRMGSGTNISRRQIEQFASISRSIGDYARLDPRAVITDEERGELAVGGANSRFNNILVDGVASNDAFGLNSNGQPSTNQQISIDWLEEIAVQISPYDVAQTGGTGALINAVTKSGTNKFEGGARFNYRDDSLVGDSQVGTPFTDFDEKTYGFWLGGPIIKDKLFFFGGYEKFKNDGLTPGTSVGLPGSGESTIFASNLGAAATEAVNQIIDIANNVWGFDPGGIEGDFQEVDEKWIIKLDWNITDGHRANLSFNRDDGILPDVGTRDNNDFSLTSNSYNERRTLERISFQVFSDWNERFSTEFRVADASYETSFELPGLLPEVEIRLPGGNDVIFGTERFRQANNLNTDTQAVFFKGTLFNGPHAIDIGFDWAREKYNNLFLESSLGRFNFEVATSGDNATDIQNVLDAFAAGNRDVFFQARLPFRSDDVESARIIWDWEVLGLFIQDIYQVLPNLNLQFGIRIEHFDVQDKPLKNDLFESTFGFTNQSTIGGENIYEPRFGFNWQPELPMRAQLRGGAGFFRGRTPGVWLSNPFTNSGETIRVFTCDSRRGRTGCTNANPDFSFTPDPNNLPEIDPRGGGAQDVDVLEPNFNQPTDIKFNLAWDMELPFLADTVFSAEWEHAEVVDGIFYQHLNLGAPTGTLPDGRQVFFADPTNTNSATRANADPRFNDVVLLRNTSEGNRTNVTLSLENTFRGGWGEIFARLAGTYNSASEVNPGTSSRAISNFTSNAIFNPNDELVATANNEISNRLTLLFSYSKDFFGIGDSIFTFFFESRSGRPFSWTFNNDANGDRINGNDLLFVPNPGDVIFTDPAEEARFFDLVARSPGLLEAQGGVACRNCDRSPRINQLDFRFIQQVDFKKYGTLELFFELENVLNLIDSDWGIQEEVGFPFRAAPVNLVGIDPATGKMIFDLVRDSGFTRVRDANGESRWNANLGVVFRY